MIWLASCLLFFAVSSVWGLALSLAAGTLTVWASLLALTLGLCFGILILSRKSNWPQISLKNLTVTDVLIISAFVLFTTRQFLWLYFYRDGQYFTLGANNIGDLPLHLTFISRFVSSAHFWPTNPIYAREPIHYPFGIDLVTAFFVKLGLPLETVLPLFGVGCSLLLGLALYFWAGSFGIGAFLFSGGVAGFAFIASGIIKDYQADLAWKNLTLSLLIPQRGFLFAFPAGLFLLTQWRKRFLQNDMTSKIPFWVEGLIWGVMPFFHFHTFLFLSFVFTVWVIAGKKYREVLPLLYVAVPLGGILSWLLTRGMSSGSIIWFKPGWMIEHQNPILFFWVNYGLFFPVTLWTLYRAIVLKSREHLLLLIPALVSYVVLLFVMLAPWEWDNTKVMVWSYLLLLPSIWELFLKPLDYRARGAVLGVLFFSGFICIYAAYGDGNRGFEINRRAETTFVCEAVKNLPREAIFATSQTYNHPVALCGKLLVAGYGGHLWSHGVKSHETEEKLRQLMMGQANWRAAAKEIGVRYVFWGSREEKDFAGSLKPWENGTTLIQAGTWGKIFDLGEKF